MMSIDRPCPLCGEKKGAFFTEAKFEIYDDCFLDGHIQLADCPACGLVYRNIKSTSPVVRYYQDEAQSVYGGADGGVCSGGSTDLDQMHYQYDFDLIASQITNKDIVVADIGCARGGWLKFLRVRGFKNLVAVDPHPQNLKTVESEGIDARFGWAEKIPMADNEADFVYSSNVFEHLYNLAPAMSEVCRTLKNGGIFYLEVPESRDYDGCDMRHRQWLMLEHINFFSPDHLVSLVELYGFKILRTSSHMKPIGNGHVQAFSSILAQKTGKPPKQPSHQPMKEAILRRLDEDAKYMMNTIDAIGNFIKEKRKLYLWGMGWQFWSVAGLLEWQEARIGALVDRNPQTHHWRWRGQNVQGLEILKTADKDDAVVIFSTVHSESMQNYLREIDFPGQVVVI